MLDKILFSCRNFVNSILEANMEKIYMHSYPNIYVYILNSVGITTVKGYSVGEMLRTYCKDLRNPVLLPEDNSNPIGITSPVDLYT